jgi:hypothetical protein
MNEFKESLKVSEEELQRQKLQKQYEKHNKERYKREISKPKWENARKRMEGEER